MRVVGIVPHSFFRKAVPPGHVWSRTVGGRGEGEAGVRGGERGGGEEGARLEHAQRSLICFTEHACLIWHELNSYLI